jgi:transcription initiation factor TFIID subunit 15
VNVATKADVENHFNTHGTGEITEIKLMNGFGFIEYKDSMDARDVVPGSYSALVLTLHHHARFANAAGSFPYVYPYPTRHPFCLPSGGAKFSLRISVPSSHAFDG